MKHLQGLKISKNTAVLQHRDPSKQQNIITMMSAVTI